MEGNIIGKAWTWIASNQTLVGYTVIASGTLVLALSGIVKSKAERSAAEESQKSRRYWILFWIIVLFGCGLSGLGTWFTKRGGNEAAQRSLADIKKENDRALKAQREQDEKTVRELREERQSILAALNAAKRDESKRITEEKIRVIRGDFGQWAEAFATNFSARKAEFAQVRGEFQKSKIEAENKQVQEQMRISAQCYPSISFAARVVEESLQMFAKKASITNVVITNLNIPENLFRRPVSDVMTLGSGSNSVWRCIVGSGRTPGAPYLNLPYYKLVLPHKRGGMPETLSVYVDCESQKLFVFFTTDMVTAEISSMVGEHPLTDYETLLRTMLQAVIERGLLEADSENPPVK